MKCPECESEMVHKTIDETLERDGRSLALNNMSGHFCTGCNEGIWDALSSRRYDKGQKFFFQLTQVNPESDIQRVRNKLNLTQKEFALRIGVGKDVISRYETGKTKPPSFLINLLKLLECHLDSLNGKQ